MVQVLETVKSDLVLGVMIMLSSLQAHEVPVKGSLAKQSKRQQSLKGFGGKSTGTL